MSDLNRLTEPNRCSVEPSLLQRKVIHFDMDCFYAAVEVRDNPSLRGKPVIVGGSPQSRAVVCTASYEARKYGVRSAMPCSKAKRLCPNGIFIHPNFEKYREASNQIRAIFAQFTDLIEPLSLDEAYLDVTDNPQKLYAVKIARLIQDEIEASLALSGSAGVAPNKLLAKIASDFRKPKGITVVLPDQVLGFMEPLSLRKIPGIGPASEERLERLGLRYCGDVWRYSIEELKGLVGERMGGWLYRRSRGLDERAVETHRDRKSIGREDTFRTDISDVQILSQKIVELASVLSARLKVKSLMGKTVTLKVKYADFVQITRSMTLHQATNESEAIAEVAMKLIEKSEAGVKPVRLLGITLSKLTSANTHPLLV